MWGICVSDHNVINIIAGVQLRKENTINRKGGGGGSLKFVVLLCNTLIYTFCMSMQCRHFPSAILILLCKENDLIVIHLSAM